MNRNTRTSRVTSRGPAATATAVALAVLAAAALPRPAHAQCDPASVLVLLDKSGSMTYELAAGGTRWEAARQAVAHVVARFAGAIDFGLLVFPNPASCDVGGVVVDIGPDTGAAIDAYLAAPPPETGNGTPLAQAFDAIAGYGPLADPAKRRAVLLVTDGKQWCYPGYDPATRFLPNERAAAFRAATGADVYVVGFSDGVDALMLNKLAWESGTPIAGCNPDGDVPGAPDSCYYRAEDTTSLEAALEAIARRVTAESCDAVDNDCDGETDEEVVRLCTSICGMGRETCSAGAWGACDAPRPADGETCDGLIDDDCDGVVDDGCECSDGESEICGTDIGVCRSGRRSCTGGRWAECTDGWVGPGPELCDGLDNNCDGVIDDGCPCVDDEVQPCGTAEGECRAGWQQCDDGAWLECQGAVSPVAEACNGRDDDCDGTIDDGATCAPGFACVDGTCVDDGGQVSDFGATGCGCVVPGRSGSPFAALLAALCLAPAVRRRRAGR